MTRLVPINFLFYLGNSSVSSIIQARESGSQGGSDEVVKLMIYYSQVSAMACISSGCWAAPLSDYHATPISCLRKEGIEGLDVQRATRVF